MRISQQIRPEGVFPPSPVTLVGALVLGCTSTAVFAGAVWARTNTPVNARMIATAAKYFVILNSLRNHVKQSGHRRIWSQFAFRLCRCRGFLFQRDHIDFNQDIFRQSRYFYRGARRRSRTEIFAINLVHSCEVVHVLEKDGGPNHLAQSAAGWFQYLRQISQHALGLCGYISSDDLLR